MFFENGSLGCRFFFADILILLKKSEDYDFVEWLGHNNCKYANIIQKHTAMSENILSLEDLKFLEKLHSHYGLEFIRFDDSGIKINNQNLLTDDSDRTDYFNLLNEISKKLKYRLNSNFQMNFTSSFNFDVVRV